jgi:hypothetical protein
MPFFISSNDFLEENYFTKSIIISLKIFAVIFIFQLGKVSRVSYNSLSEILFWIFVLNFIFMTIQFFFLPHIKLSGTGINAEWIKPAIPVSILTGRAVGLLGNANVAASFIFIINIFLYEWLESKPKIKWFVLISSILAIVLFSKSRNTVIVGILFGGYIYLFVRKKWNTFFNYIVILVVVMLGVILSSESSFTNTIFRFSEFERQVNNLSVRIIVNSQAISIWWNHLFWFGGGVGTESFYMEKYHAMRAFSEMLYTQMLTESGLFGFLFHIFFVTYLFLTKFKTSFQIKKAKYILIVIFLVSFIETVFYSQQLYLFIIFIMGWISANRGEPSQIQIENFNI